MTFRLHENMHLRKCAKYFAHRLLHAKDYFKRHSPIQIDKDKLKYGDSYLASFAGCRHFPSRKSVTLRVHSLVSKKFHVLGQKTTFVFPLIIYCKFIRLRITPQPFSVMFAQKLARICGINSSPRWNLIELCIIYDWHMKWSNVIEYLPISYGFFKLFV